MKTVLFVYHTSSIGGGSYCLLNILKNIDRKQINPYILLRSNGPLVDEIKKLGIEVMFLPTLRTVPYNNSTIKPLALINALNIIRSMNKLNHIIHQVKADVVYCNTMMLYPYLRTAKRSGCKTIMHVREHWPEREHSWQRDIALKHIQKYADEIIAINRFSASMVESYGRKASIVYDWVDMSTRFQRMPLNEIFNEDMNDKKTFLYLGGMQKIKGAREVFAAFSLLPNENYRLLALGINTQYESDGIKRVIKTFLRFFKFKSYSEQVIDIAKSDKRIRCIAGIYDIRHLYEQAYCVLSYFTIPHANLSLAESIICNTVNIAAQTDESLEYSNEGKLAILYQENSFEHFFEALKSIEDIHQEYKDKIKQDSKIIEDMFSPKKNIRQLNHIINSI